MATKTVWKRIAKAFILFITYGGIYYTLEVLYKTLISGSPLHWSMFLLGGLCGLIIGGINNYIPWEMTLPNQATIGAVIVTTLEFIFGCILNLWLGLGVWDYSRLPMAILGQVCLPFSLIWFGLSLVVIVLDDYLRYVWFGEEKPHYHWRETCGGS